MTAFFVIGLAGLALLVASLIAGEVLEGLFDGIGGDWLSGAGLAGFLGAFGFAGALAYDLSESLAVAIVVGLVVGVLIGVLVALGTRFLQRGGSDSTVRTASLVGRAGSVSTPVPADGYGEITLVAAGHITRLNARSGAPVPAGTRVTITEVLSATAVMVEPAVSVPPAVGEEVALDQVPPPPAGVEPDPGTPHPGPQFTQPPQTWSPWEDPDRR
ncbi:NfeD family protein [Auraticoccus monumenti]|uniref:NfeD-like C-terminal, partner-binding n=1 Tax=Auraticoccus monumenti TaxID=675864 RepID=A0A1G6WKM4_9ACTN|nr:hypothetical protein [Auraticoccus monumenti]SDD66344.1 hypothetical protein SAMN04489747_1469 [Auraticoccus monumenti]